MVDSSPENPGEGPAPAPLSADLGFREVVQTRLDGMDKAIDKSDLGFTKQIDSLRDDLKTVSKKVDDLKDQLSSLEARGAGTVSGTQSAKQDSKDSKTLAISLVGLSFGAAGLLIVLVDKLAK